ncbi:MAG: CoA-binding protein [Bacteroidales bacterium]|nr:CoA-binding protein [Bacteroidales bacterium]
MNKKEIINNFLESKKFTMAGVSRNKKKFGYVVFNELKQKGYDITPINPNTTEIDGTNCHADVLSVPGEIENLFIAVPKSQTVDIVKQAKEKGVKRIWIQQMSDTTEALETAKEAGIELIAKKCIFMYAEPVSGVHKFHRFFAKLFGGLYK